MICIFCLFYYILRHFTYIVNIKNKKTGKILLSPILELYLIEFGLFTSFPKAQEFFRRKITSRHLNAHIE